MPPVAREFAECNFICYSRVMKTQRDGHTDGHIDMIRTTDQAAKTREPCQANVYEAGVSNPSCDRFQYEACGEYLRKRNNGSTYCPEHGPMY